MLLYADLIILQHHRITIAGYTGQNETLDAVSNAAQERPFEVGDQPDGRRITYTWVAIDALASPGWAWRAYQLSIGIVPASRNSVTPRTKRNER